MTRRKDSLPGVRRASKPVILLVLLSLLSLAARAAWLGEPCHRPCRTAADHLLIFDETYYVNAARVIAGVHVPAGAPYADAPVGVDPNAEHPQLAKLIIAGSIEAFGDGPVAWRLGSLVFGTLAIIGLFVLVRAAGGGEPPALGAATLMAADNLLLVHGRIGTLDIYAVAFMIWALALYLRGHPLGAGTLIGVGACVKLVVPYALLALLLYEGGHFALRRRDAAIRLRRLAACAALAAIALIGVLALLDAIAPPYDQAVHARLAGGPFTHISHMLSFAAGQVSTGGPRGIASYPWQWFGDYKPITYLNIVPDRPAPGLAHVHPASHFLGVVSPPILLLALPALVLAALSARRSATELDVLALAWSVGTWLPFELLSALWRRTSYLYYMVIVMPGIYVAIARLLTRPEVRRRAVPLALWIAAVVSALVLLYPFTPLP